MRPCAGTPPPEHPRPLRVLHVIDALRLGGAEQLLVAMVRELSALRPHRQRRLRLQPRRRTPGVRRRALGAMPRLVELVPVDRLYDPRLLRARRRGSPAGSAPTCCSPTSRPRTSTRGSPRSCCGARTSRRAHDARARERGQRLRQLADGRTARLSSRIVAPTREIAAAYGARFTASRRRPSR